MGTNIANVPFHVVCWTCDTGEYVCRNCQDTSLEPMPITEFFHELGPLGKDKNSGRTNITPSKFKRKYVNGNNVD